MLIYEVKHWDYEQTTTLGLYSTLEIATAELRTNLDMAWKREAGYTDGWDIVVHELDNPDAKTTEYTNAQLIELAYPDGDPGTIPAPQPTRITATTTELGNGNWYARFN